MMCLLQLGHLVLEVLEEPSGEKSSAVINWIAHI